MDDTLALNEHERLTQIYTVRNANEKRVKKRAECDKNTLTYGTKNDTKRKRNRRNTQVQVFF